MLIIFPLSYALSIVLVKDTFFRVVAFSLFSIVLFYGGQLTGISLFYPFIPTLIHVYVFTSAFMLLGAIKSQSFYGYLSFYLLILGGISFFLMPGEIMTSLSGCNVTNKIPEIEFIYLSFAQTFFNGEMNLYLEKASRFAAFAYTYHYLNWFSKTGVIGWNKGFTRKHYTIITLLYLFFVGLFLYDYRLGFYFVSLLSLLHVLLELPLDIIVFKDLSKVLMKKRSLS